MSLWMDLAIKQSKLFIEDNVNYSNAIVNCDSIRYIWVCAYNALVRLHLLGPLEGLPTSEKNNVWETAKEISAGRVNLPKTIELSKALYCLEYVLNLKEWNGTPIN